MIVLGTPHLRFHRSFLAAVDEFRANGQPATRTIEADGGEFEGEPRGKRRSWITT